MFKYKVLKCALLLVSIVAFCLPLFSEFVRRKTLERYDLRWLQTFDRQSRTQTITVRNSGNQPKENLVLELDPGPNSARVLRELEISSSERGPYQKFLDTVELTNAQSSETRLTAPEKNKLMQALDTHYSQRGLDDIDAVFDGLLKDRLTAGKNTSADAQFTGQRTRDWHLSWKQKCAVVKPTAECPKVEALLTDWEEAKAGFRKAAFDNWQQNTGVRLASVSDQLSFDKKFFITLSLAANEVKVLRFRYAHSPATVTPFFRSTSGEQTVRFNNTADLFSPFLSILYTVHPHSTFAAVILLLILAALFGPLLLPLRILSVQQIFNRALKLEDYDYWKHAMERHRFFILQEFRRLRAESKMRTDASDDEVLDFVRAALTIKSKRGKVPFRSTAALNSSISLALSRFVDRAI
jgi:hypothetical protein